MFDNQDESMKQNPDIIWIAKRVSREFGEVVEVKVN